MRQAAYGCSESHLSAKCLLYILLKLVLRRSKENFDRDTAYTCVWLFCVSGLDADKGWTVCVDR